ncbi:MAG: hypothetical protein CVT93_02590 [Bacteroidetes bacterium HGW-Bacteroidetes-10]|nr:MAG: hypothetical protein CVT93_02590 [Bacteroidetes bacterium HGW-Bacteroidetes-10]
MGFDSLIHNLSKFNTFDPEGSDINMAVRRANNLAIYIAVAVPFLLAFFFAIKNFTLYSNVVVVLVIAALLAGGCRLLNMRGGVFISGFLLNLIVSGIFILLSALWFGPGPGFHYYLILMSVVPLLTFKSTRFFYTVFLMLLSLISFIYVEYLMQPEWALYIFPENAVSEFRIVSAVFLFLMMLFVIIVNQKVLRDKEQKLIRLADEITRKNKELADNNRAKDRFFSIISHDLKGPVGTMSTFLEYLSDNTEEFTPEQFSESLLALKHSSHDVYALLDNLLAWSRVQSGNMKMNKCRNNLSEVINSNVELMKTLFSQKEVNIFNRVKDNNLEACFDREMIDTVVRNLLSNSLKFTEEGGEIWVEARDEEDVVTVSVGDNGTGMNQETVNNLFRIDVKQNTVLGTGGEKGTGLGLILCKGFIENHGGRIDVISTPGKGSIFTFTIPRVCL